MDEWVLHKYHDSSKKPSMMCMAYQHEVSRVVVAQIFTDGFETLISDIVPEKIDLFQSFIARHDASDGTRAFRSDAVVHQVELLQCRIVLSLLRCESLRQCLQCTMSIRCLHRQFIMACNLQAICMMAGRWKVPGRRFHVCDCWPK
jgi:hypothetical protein